jgi:hypothetical protein
MVRRIKMDIQEKIEKHLDEKKGVAPEVNERKLSVYCFMNLEVIVPYNSKSLGKMENDAINKATKFMKQAGKVKMKDIEVLQSDATNKTKLIVDW